jgi:soluble lytic murein transglycosylase-like protein
VAACDRVTDADLSRWVQEAADREGLTPDLLRAVIRKESSFLPCAVSPKGALGLMQLMPSTAQDLDVADPLDPEQSIAGGARLLARLLERYGNNLALALGAYNAGAAAVDAFGRVPPYRETLNYVSGILRDLAVK